MALRIAVPLILLALCSGCAVMRGGPPYPSDWAALPTSTSERCAIHGHFWNVGEKRSFGPVSFGDWAYLDAVLQSGETAPTARSDQQLILGLWITNERIAVQLLGESGQAKSIRSENTLSDCLGTGAFSFAFEAPSQFDGTGYVRHTTIRMFVISDRQLVVFSDTKFSSESEHATRRSRIREWYRFARVA